MGSLFEDRFEVWPASPDRRCTVDSVAAHTLYEKSDPVHLHGPGCVLDLENMRVTGSSDGRIAVSGSRLRRTPEYHIKLEGADYRIQGHLHCRHPRPGHDQTDRSHT